VREVRKGTGRTGKDGRNGEGKGRGTTIVGEVEKSVYVLPIDNSPLNYLSFKGKSK
jgi:hypothetical protein